MIFLIARKGKTVAGTTHWSLTGLLAASLLAVSLLAGCSGIKTYPNTLDKNLHIQTQTDSGSFFSSVRAAVDIYRVDAQCNAKYEGTIQLQEASVDFGIPTGKMSRLAFIFASSSFFGGTRGQISYDTLLEPRTGYHYQIKVRYQDDIYNVTVHETRSGESQSREVERRRLSTCNVAPSK